MGQQQSVPTPQPAPAPAQQPCSNPQLGKSGKKICCSCPDTKKARDECVVKNGEDLCKKEIEAHKVCLREEGFIVP
eukprot:gene10787-11988_t